MSIRIVIPLAWDKSDWGDIKDQSSPTAAKQPNAAMSSTEQRLTTLDACIKALVEYTLHSGHTGVLEDLGKASLSASAWYRRRLGFMAT